MSPGTPADAWSLAAEVAPTLVDISVSTTDESLVAGTGMVLSPSGEILTNNHVIEGATAISVTDVGNRSMYPASVVGYDRALDIAVLQIAGGSGLKTADIADTSQVTIGEGVIAIGNGAGTGGAPSYSGGSITATGQSITAEDETSADSEQLSRLVETNADVIPGDSGGALVDAAGKVVAMLTAGSQGFEVPGPATEGYGIPIGEALSVASQIERGRGTGTVHVGATASLGVYLGPATPGSPGAAITEVVPGGPADSAQLVPGDTITAFEGRPVGSPDSLTSLLLRDTPGAWVDIQYLDPSGQRQVVEVQLDSGPPA